MTEIVSDDGELAPADANAEQFRCPNCRADMAFDPSAQKLSCGHCGHVVEIAGEGDSAIVEHDLEHGLAATAQRGYGHAVRRATCKECNATVSFDAAATAAACDFCGSWQVLQQEENRNVLRPESLVPFQVDRDTATKSFSTWISKLWFRPSALKSEATVSEMRGIYVPYWTFDAHVDSSWTAQSGTYYYVTETYTERDAQGNTVTKTRQVQKVRWRPAWGSRNDFYDDLLVCASRGLPPKLAAKAGDYDTGGLVPYEPRYLAGWRAEEYGVELNAAWKDAVSRMESSQHSRCANDVPGDTHRFLRVTNRFHDETFKHVLLPMWVSAYRFRDEVYRVLINGQTGKVTGKAPLSWFKILLFAAVVIAIIGAIVYFATRQ